MKITSQKNVNSPKNNDTRCLEGMGSNENGESQHRAGAVAEEGVGSHHFEIQDKLLRTGHRTGQDQHCTDVVYLPNVEVTLFIS